MSRKTALSNNLFHLGQNVQKNDQQAQNENQESFITANEEEKKENFSAVITKSQSVALPFGGLQKMREELREKEARKKEPEIIHDELDESGNMSDQDDNPYY